MKYRAVIRFGSPEVIRHLLEENLIDEIPVKPFYRSATGLDQMRWRINDHYIREQGLQPWQFEILDISEVTSDMPSWQSYRLEGL